MYEGKSIASKSPHMAWFERAFMAHSHRTKAEAKANFVKCLSLITARKQSCGKVMFLYLSVINPPPSRQTPLPRDGYWSRWYASCWNAFLLPPANVVCEGYVFTGICHSFCSQGGGMRGFIQERGACVVLFRGGVHGFIQGGCAWFYLGGHAWFHSGGHAWFYLGGMHRFIQGGMHRFIWGGACMVLLGVCGFIQGGMHGFIQGVCMVLFGGHTWFYLGGHAWFYLGGHAWFFQFFRIQWDTVNERAVRILLECILVLWFLPCCLIFLLSTHFRLVWISP